MPTNTCSSARTGGPLAASVSFFGFLVVVAALWLSRPKFHDRAADDINERRAA